MALDIGGGSRGEGGKLADGNDSTPSNPVTNREQTDYTIGRPLSDAELQTIEPEGEVTEVDTKQYIIKAVGNDFLSCKEIIGGAETGQLVLIVKPPELRRTPFDDQTLSGITYNYSSAILRTISENGLAIEQTISPSYILNETIIYGMVVKTTDVLEIVILDLNTGGRTWQPVARTRRYRVKAVLGDILTCNQFLNGAEVDDNVSIAKPFELRQSEWDNKTIDGITYDYSDANTREATQGAESEDQKIIPPYIVDTTIIMAILIEEGTDIAGVNLQSVNGAGRAWSKFIP